MTETQPDDTTPETPTASAPSSRVASADLKVDDKVRTKDGRKGVIVQADTNAVLVEHGPEKFERAWYARASLSKTR